MLISHTVPTGMDSVKNWLLHVHDDVNYDIFSFAQLFGCFRLRTAIGSKNIIVKVSKGILSFFFLSYLPSCVSTFVRERWKKSKFKSKRRKKNSAFDRFVTGQLPQYLRSCCRQNRRTGLLFASLKSRVFVK